MENISQITEKIYGFINKNCHTDLSRVNDQTLLFQEGLIDSMGFILLIDYLEEEFKIKSSDEDLVEENFESISSITEYIIQKMNIINKV